MRQEKGKLRRHEVQFYSDDSSFLVGCTRFIEAALRDGNVVIVAATESHQRGVLYRLQELGVNIAAAIEEGRYLALDVARTLSSFMVNNLPDSVQFSKVTGDLLAMAAKAAKGNPPRVTVYGECSPFLWAQGNPDAAVQLEHLWDEIAKTYTLDVLCGYVLTDFQREQQTDITGRICAEHSAVLSQ